MLSRNLVPFLNYDQSANDACTPKIFNKTMKFSKFSKQMDSFRRIQNSKTSYWNCKFAICFILKKVHTAIHFRCNWKQRRSAIKSGFKVKQPKILCFVFIVIFIWLFLCDIYIKVIKSFNFWDWRVLVHIQIIFYDVQPEVLYFIYLFWK